MNFAGGKEDGGREKRAKESNRATNAFILYIMIVVGMGFNSKKTVAISKCPQYYEGFYFKGAVG